MNLLQRIGRGLEAGLFAGGGVAVLFFATDVFGLAPLRTVTALAAPLFGDTATLSADSWIGFAESAAAVGLYTVLHFVAFAVLGVVASWVIPAASFWTTLGRGALFGAVACSGAFLAGTALIGSESLTHAVGPTGLVLTNTMAGVIMAAVFSVHAADERTAAA
jgi:hypothetical protein